MCKVGRSLNQRITLNLWSTNGTSDTPTSKGNRPMCAFCQRLLAMRQLRDVLKLHRFSTQPRFVQGQDPTALCCDRDGLCNLRISCCPRVANNRIVTSRRLHTRWKEPVNGGEGRTTFRSTAAPMALSPCAPSGLTCQGYTRRTCLSVSTRMPRPRHCTPIIMRKRRIYKLEIAPTAAVLRPSNRMC